MLLVKTTQPDFRWETFEQWKRYIVAERFEAEKKVTEIKIWELKYPRIKLQE